MVYFTSDSINIDGKAKEDSWHKVDWSESFVDIIGMGKPLPEHDTRFKLLWSKKYLYVFAEMEEPHIWGDIAERDAVIYHNDDFEVFIDPDGDSHNYTEIEVNALNTVWDLFLLAPYGYHDRDNVLWQWDIRELKTNTNINGTLNNPGDLDENWTLEMAIPLKTLNEFAGSRKAGPGVQWRVNFSRVDWAMEIQDGKYTKKLADDGKPLPENNWVWSAQGEIAMHIPDRWGYIQFSEIEAGFGKENFSIDPDYEIKQSLYAVFHQLKSSYKKQKAYPKKLNFNALLSKDSCKSRFHYAALKDRYELYYSSCTTNTEWVINEEGRLYSRPPSSFYSN